MAVFFNPASLLPSPEVAIAPTPQSNEGFVVGAALKEIGNLVKKKADVESLRTEANQYADYAETQGNTSIAALLRGRSQGYSLLTDTNQERSSFLKGVVELTKLEEAERSNTIKASISAYDNMLDDKLRGAQADLGKTVALYNKWESDYAAEKRAHMASEARSKGFHAAFTERANPWASQLQTKQSYIDKLMREAPDRINKSTGLPADTRPFGGGSEASVATPGVVPGADPGYENPEVGLRDIEVAPPGGWPKAPVVPAAEGEPEALLFPDESLPVPRGSAPPSLDRIPDVNAPSIYDDQVNPTPGAVAPPVLSPPVPGADPSIPSGTVAPPAVAPPALKLDPTIPNQTGTINFAPSQEVKVGKTGVPFIPVPEKVTELPSNVPDTPHNRAILDQMSGMRDNILIYNRDLSLLDRSLSQDLARFQDPEMVADAKQQLVEAARTISELSYPIGSKEWLDQAKKIMKDTSDYIKGLDVYTPGQQDKNEAAAQQQEVQIFDREDLEGLPGKGRAPDQPPAKPMRGIIQYGSGGPKYFLIDPKTNIPKPITDDTNKDRSKYVTGDLIGPAGGKPGVNPLGPPNSPGAPAAQPTGKVQVGPSTSVNQLPKSAFRFGTLRDFGATKRAPDPGVAIAPSVPAPQDTPAFGPGGLRYLKPEDSILK